MEITNKNYRVYWDNVVFWPLDVNINSLNGKIVVGKLSDIFEKAAVSCGKRCGYRPNRVA